ncbi:PREDICTED: general odorant-binding protein 19d-like [Nicrophorus vespilloides]|uniref:General odorant-binding protein 19d-like n=1 Tax=Nicrophorus vespilloides TaxID=110193 RepID=A0ABM1NEG6_NICVS|nr:PREDICTED: general odorant-binding protein 19d-like [Nicrophorus vespilloides]
MHYFTFVYVLVIATLASVQAEDNKVSKEKLREAAMIIVNDCKEKEGASDEDIAALKEHKLPKSEKGLCMIQCLYNTIKIMKDGKFNKAGAIEVSSQALKGDEAKLTKMKEVMNECEKEIGETTGCQVAKLITECIAKHGKEFGITIPHMKSM